MNKQSNHSETSYELVNNLHNTLLEGFYPSWADLNAEVPIPEHPNFRLVTWGEEKDGKEKLFSLSLRQGLADHDKELFTAYVPADGTYEPLLSAGDKILSHFERSLAEPVEALHTKNAYSAFTKEIMQPLLDVLNEGDFERAAALTPMKYRLCGYQEVESDFIYNEFAHGWAGQFADISIPAGRYPVFAENYHYHEADGQWTNQLKDFRGLSIFLVGDCVADSDYRKKDEYPYERTIWSAPYCHAVAHDILEGRSSIHLLPPYTAEPVHFVSISNGENLTTYKIVDNGLPDRMKQNPMELRSQNYFIHRTMGMSDNAVKLYNAFVREYSHSLVTWYSGSMPLNVLSRSEGYSPEAMRELLDNKLIQRRECDGIAYELSAQERLNLFHIGKVSGKEREGLKWDAEYKRCCQEAQTKKPLADKIQEASRKAGASSHSQGDEKSKSIPQHEL